MALPLKQHMNYEKQQPKRIGELLNLPRRSGRGDESKNIDSKTPTSDKSPHSERASLIGQFADKLNLTRDGKKFKKLTYASVGVKLAHIPTKDLYYLWKVCEDSPSFSKKFWWLLNPKNHQ